MKTLINVVVVIIVLAGVGFGVWYTLPHTAPFCFDFVRNMQFGDREVKHPVNMGSVANGIVYYLPEVPALQTVLQEQGFYIDPFETTGGKVYAAPFLGPSTHQAVFSFQKKYKLPQTGVVDDMTLDKLGALYTCPPAPVTATSTSASTTKTTK